MKIGEQFISVKTIAIQDRAIFAILWSLGSTKTCESQAMKNGVICPDSPRLHRQDRFEEGVQALNSH
jgi:hypothetical protein